MMVRKLKLDIISKKEVEMKMLYIFLLVFPLFYSEVSLGGEQDVYNFDWLDKDKKIYVLQNKVFRKKGRWSASIGILKGVYGDYQNTYGIEVSPSYFITEEFGVELVFRHYHNSENNAFELLKGINGVTPFIRKEKSLMGAIGLWSPFYGKINTFNKIFYFDWYFGLGLGKLVTESNHESFKTKGGSSIFLSEKQTTILGKTGVKFYLNNRFDFRVEFFQKAFFAPTGLSPSSLRLKSDLNLSFGVTF